MAFNKAKEEKKWNLWKEKEKLELRRYGIDEDAIENEVLLQMLLQADQEILRILLLKTMGYSIQEIAEKTGICEHTIYTRITRLRKKLKNLKESE